MLVIVVSCPAQVQIRKGLEVKGSVWAWHVLAMSASPLNQQGASQFELEVVAGSMSHVHSILC